MINNRRFVPIYFYLIFKHSLIKIIILFPFEQWIKIVTYILFIGLTGISFPEKTLPDADLSVSGQILPLAGC